MNGCNLWKACASWHNWVQLWTPVKPPDTMLPWCSQGFRGGLYWAPFSTWGFSLSDSCTPDRDIICDTMWYNLACVLQFSVCCDARRVSAGPSIGPPLCGKTLVSWATVGVIALIFSTATHREIYFSSSLVRKQWNYHLGRTCCRA